MELCVPLAIHSRCDGGKGRRYPAGGDWLRAFFTGLLASAAAAAPVVVAGEADAGAAGAGGAGADWSAAAGGGGRPVAAAAAAAAVMSGAATLRGTTAAVNDASVAASIAGTPSGITWNGTADDAAEEEVAAPSAEGAAASAGDAAAAAGAVAAATAAAAACAASVAPWGAPSTRVVVCVAFAARECMRRCCGGGCGDRPSEGAVAVCTAAGMDDARRCTAPFALPASALVTLAARCHMPLMLMKRSEKCSEGGAAEGKAAGRSLETISSSRSAIPTDHRSLPRPHRPDRPEQRAGRGNDGRKINPLDHSNIHTYVDARRSDGSRPPRLASPSLRNDRLHPIATSQAHTSATRSVTIRAQLQTRTSGNIKEGFSIDR